MLNNQKSRVITPFLGAFSLALATSIAGCAAPNAAPSNGAVTSVTQSAVSLTIPLGTGMEGPVFWGRSLHFVDVVKAAAPWRQIKTDDIPPIDAKGWPQTDFRFWGFTNFPNAEGAYHVSFVGQGKVQTPSWNSHVVSNLKYDAATNTTTADVTMTKTQTDLYIEFVNTKRTPTFAVNSGLTNLRVFRPGYALTTKQTFANEFINHLKRFNLIRYMDFTNTNNNETMRWADRART